MYFLHKNNNFDQRNIKRTKKGRKKPCDYFQRNSAQNIAKMENLFATKENRICYLDNCLWPMCSSQCHKGV